MMSPVALASTSGVSPLWYFSRATGVVALVLLTVVVLLGVLTRAGAPLPGLPRFAVGGLHRNVSLLTLALLVVHVAASVLDPFAPIRLVDAVLPFGSAYRALWLGLGAVAFDILLAVLVTSLLRSRLRPRLWRAVHWSGYAAWPVALLHGFGTGTDAATGWLLASSTGCVLAVGSAVLYRVGIASGSPLRLRVGGGAAVLIAPVLLAGWLAGGPLAPHWAARAGTPAGLLAHPDSTGPAHTSTLPVTGRPIGSALWTAAVTQASGTSGVVLTFQGPLRGGPAGRLVIVLTGQPDPGGGLTLASGTVRLTPAAVGDYTGAVTGLRGNHLSAVLTGPGGRVGFTVELQLTSGSATGQVSLT
jgi:sulfoxide reductase heme-binding subunit YedZ